MLDKRVHIARLKERILRHFPNLKGYNNGRNGLIGFQEDIGSPLAKACAYDYDSDAVHLAKLYVLLRIYTTQHQTRDSFVNISSLGAARIYEKKGTG